MSTTTLPSGSVSVRSSLRHGVGRGRRRCRRRRGQVGGAQPQVVAAGCHRDPTRALRRGLRGHEQDVLVALPSQVDQGRGPAGSGQGGEDHEPGGLVPPGRGGQVGGFELHERGHRVDVAVDAGAGRAGRSVVMALLRRWCSGVPRRCRLPPRQGQPGSRTGDLGR
ncbi:hypothetical protein ACFQZ4_36785 [Catellatospora coxensis]